MVDAAAFARWRMLSTLPRENGANARCYAERGDATVRYVCCPFVCLSVCPSIYLSSDTAQNLTVEYCRTLI